MRTCSTRSPKLDTRKPQVITITIRIWTRAISTVKMLHFAAVQIRILSRRLLQVIRCPAQSLTSLTHQKKASPQLLLSNASFRISHTNQRLPATTAMRCHHPTTCSFSLHTSSHLSSTATTNSHDTKCSNPMGSADNLPKRTKSLIQAVSLRTLSQA